jgi:serine/threonine protein kinase
MNHSYPYTAQVSNSVTFTTGMNVEEGSDRVDRTTPIMTSFVSFDTSTTSTRTETTVDSNEYDVSQGFPPLPAHAIESGTTTTNDNKPIGATIHLRHLRGDVRRKLLDHEVEQKIFELIGMLVNYPDAPQRPEDLCFIKKIDKNSVKNERRSSTIYHHGKRCYKRVAVTKFERDELIRKYFNQNQGKRKQEKQDALVTSHVDIPCATGSQSYFCLRMFTEGKCEELAEYCKRHGILNVHKNDATRNMDVLLRCAAAAGGDMDDKEMVRYFFDFINHFWPREFDVPSMDMDDDDGDDDDDDEFDDDQGGDDNDNDYEGDECSNNDEDEDDKFNFSEDGSDTGSNDCDWHVTGDSLEKSHVIHTTNFLSCKDAVDSRQSPPWLEPPCGMPLIDDSVSTVSLNQQDTKDVFTPPTTQKVENCHSFADKCANLQQLSLVEDKDDIQEVPKAVLVDSKDHTKRMLRRVSDIVSPVGINKCRETGIMVVNDDKANSVVILAEEQLQPMLAEPVRSIDWDDVAVHDFIGAGTFAMVYKVQLQNHYFPPQSNSFSFPQDSIPASRDDLLLRENNNDVTEKTYALKRFKPDGLLFSDVQLGVKGMILEAKLLSQVLRTHHPNIVIMYGMSPNFLKDPKQGFIILEYLKETLDKRLLGKKRRQSMLGDQTILFEQFTLTKLYGLDIASALAHLHRHGILYRDLKPANIGFDEHGTIKLFDFDSSRLLDEEDMNSNRRMTARVGSLRYMSPECFMGKPYGFPSDVFSFAILLWEIYTLERPYNHVHTTSVLLKMASLGRARPPLSLVMSRSVKALLKKSWNPNPDRRPGFRSIMDTLRSLEFSNDTKERRASLFGRSLNGSTA